MTRKGKGEEMSNIKAGDRVSCAMTSCTYKVAYVHNTDAVVINERTDRMIVYPARLLKKIPLTVKRKLFVAHYLYRSGATGSVPLSGFPSDTYQSPQDYIESHKRSDGVVDVKIIETEVEFEVE